MKIFLPALIAGIFGCLNSLPAGVLFDEQFSADGPLSNYVGSGKIFESEVSSGTVTSSVSGGTLNLGLTSDQPGSLYTYTNFGGARPLVSMQFDFTPNGGTDSPRALNLYIGSYASIGDFNPNWNVWGNGMRTWAKTTGGANSPYPVRAWSGAEENTYYGMDMSLGVASTWTIFLNQSGGAQQYSGTDGSQYTLNNNMWALFVDGLLVQNNIPKGVGGGNASLSGMVFMLERNHAEASSSFSIDNLIIRDDLNISPIPEPSVATALLFGGVLALRHRRR